MNSDLQGKGEFTFANTDKLPKQQQPKQPPVANEDTANTIIEESAPVFHETLLDTADKASHSVLDGGTTRTSAPSVNAEQRLPEATASDKTSLLSDLAAVLQPSGQMAPLRAAEPDTKAHPPHVEGEEAGLVPGEVLGGKYRVLELLGRGGMGAVYKVEHLLFSHQKLFALKVLHRDFAGNEMFRKRFQREVEIAMEFVHEHAVQIRDFGETASGLPYFTMDFSPGVSLRKLLEQEHRLPVRRALAIVRQVLSVIESAHAKGIAHRDLKPENILLEQRHGEDHAMVLDFGIAKVVMSERSQIHAANLTQAHIVGTPAYMSPEQTLGEDTDMRTDIYAMGVILFELVTGNLPFSGTLRDIFVGHVTKDVPRPTKLCAGLPAAVETIILKAMAKKREQRFDTARGMMQAVDEALVTRASASPKPWRRWLITAVGLVLIAVGYGYGKWSRAADVVKPADPRQIKPNDAAQPTPTPKLPAELPTVKPSALARADLCRTAHYQTKGVHELRGSKWTVPLEAAAVTCPAMSEGVLYIGATYFENTQRLGRVCAIDLAKGQPKWSFATQEAVQSAPAVAGGIAYFGCENGCLYALDIRDGSEVWKCSVGKITSSAPAVADGVVYVGSEDHNLYAVSCLDGKEKWRFKTNNPIYSSPAVHQGVVYCASSDSFCYAMNAKDGRLRWKCSTGSYGASTMAVADGTAYFTSGSYLYAVDCATGQWKWNCALDSRSYSPAVAGDLIYVVSRSVYAIDKQGKVKWNSAFNWTRTPPCVADGIVYIGADDHVVALDAETGEERWRYHLRGITGIPAVHEGVVFAGSRDGAFVAIH